MNLVISYGIFLAFALITFPLVFDFQSIPLAVLFSVLYHDHLNAGSTVGLMHLAVADVTAITATPEANDLEDTKIHNAQ